ncbi:unnamed protein product [Amoebophrya sp. A25]|nr:unnamed protein product [Amoebophrya sp. A25]|eukprot:GSA25T00002070001.1
MPSGKKKYSCGLGKAINNAQKKAAELNAAFHGKRTFLEGQEHGVSCLESTNLDDFLAKAELANQEFQAIRGRFSIVEKSVVSQREKALGMARKLAEIKGVIIPIPRRPVWRPGIDGERLQEMEHDAFLTWRKKLALLEEAHGYVMTPFERNLDFWRQLWRVVEKSDLVCTICDCRDPLFYRSLDLERYAREMGGALEERNAQLGEDATPSTGVEEDGSTSEAGGEDESVAEETENGGESKDGEDSWFASLNANLVQAEESRRYQYSSKTMASLDRVSEKRTLLILNKADYMPAPLRRAWKAHFEAEGTDVVFFSAKYELGKLGIDIDLPTEVLNKDDEAEEAGAGADAKPRRRAVKDVRSGTQIQGLNASKADDKLRRKGPKHCAAPEIVPVVAVQPKSVTKPRSVFLAISGSDEESDDDEDEKESDAESKNADEQAVTSTPGKSSTASENADDPSPTHASETTEDVTAKTSVDESDSTSAHPRVPESALDGGDILDCDGLVQYLRSRLPKETRDANRPVVGFCGYPNVGKSSIINALFGTKKVSMSRQPGKTKHFQTLEGENFTLCDCPGLVFPSIVTTKAHLVINSVMPIDQLRSEYMQPVNLILEKMGTKRLYEHYKCEPLQLRTDPGMRFLSSFATNRRHFLRDLVPDTTWAASRVLKDYTTGVLLHCEQPPMSAAMKALPSNGEGAGTTAASAEEESRILGAIAEESRSNERLLPGETDDEAEKQEPASSDLHEVDEETEEKKYDATRDVKAYDAFDDWQPASLAEMLAGQAAPVKTKRALRREAKSALKGDVRARKEVFFTSS